MRAQICTIIIHACPFRHRVFLTSPGVTTFRKREGSALLSALLLAACAAAPRAQDTAPLSPPLEILDRRAERPQVVIVVLDGVRHQEIFDDNLAGEITPNLRRLASTRGALVGGPGESDAMWATGPNFVSLPGYREIMTGRPSADCQQNACAPIALDTLADEFRAEAASAREIAVISSWEGIAQAASRHPESIVISCGRKLIHNRDVLAADSLSTALLRAGEGAPPAPGSGDFRPDALTARIALEYLARERPRFLFLGLGEPDEYAHLDDYAGYLRSLRAADRVIADIDALFEQTGAWKRDALLLVTTDHGRARDFRHHGGDVPESGRVWLLAAGQRVARSHLASTRQVAHLADIASTIRLLAGLPSDTTTSTGAPIASLVGLER